MNMHQQSLISRQYELSGEPFGLMAHGKHYEAQYVKCGRTGDLHLSLWGNKSHFIILAEDIITDLIIKNAASFPRVSSEQVVA